MKISIITAVYNNATHIEDCIKSVISQDYNDIEHIIIDGQSKDGTVGIVNKYIDKISVFISEPDKGIYDAINKGLKAASGEVIGLLHSDDIFDNKGTISKLASFMQDEEINGVYGDLIYVDKNDVSKVFRYWKSSEFSRNMLRLGWMPPHPTLFLRKKAIDKVGFYNQQYKIAADYDFMIRALHLETGYYKYIGEVVTRMRTGGASNKSIKNILLKSYEDYLIIKRNKIGGFFTLLRKNLSKISQFMKKL